MFLCHIPWSQLKWSWLVMESLDWLKELSFWLSAGFQNWNLSVNVIRQPWHTLSTINISCLPFELLLITWAVYLLKGPPPCETDETCHNKLSSSIMGCNLTGPSKIHPTYTSDSFPPKALTSFLKVKLDFGAAGPLLDCTPVLAPPDAHCTVTVPYIPLSYGSVSFIARCLFFLWLQTLTIPSKACHSNCCNLAVNARRVKYAHPPCLSAIPQPNLIIPVCLHRFHQPFSSFLP